MTTAVGEAPPQASSECSPEEAVDHLLKRLPASCCLLVAFSGGGDSTGLLSALSAAQRTHPGLVLYSATVDHGLRRDSAQEAEAASLVSRKLGVPHAILPWSGDKPSTGLQAAAREARYRRLADEAVRVGADFVLTAHNRDDQAETIYMRSLRKTGAAEGMDEAVLIYRRVWVLRPFLHVGREGIRTYLRQRGLSWSEDPSNENPAFERVRIRQSDLLSSAGLVVEDRPSPFALSAQFVRDHVKVCPGPAAVVDLHECHVHHSAHWMALATLAAVIGGRVHGPGGESARAIIDRLAGSADFRMTANRAVFDRRADRLYVYREERGLPEVTLAPRQSSYWDGRYEVTNRGSSLATIGAGRAVTAAVPLVPSAAYDALPREVVRRVAASAPRILRGDAAMLTLRPVLAPFDKFLPARKLELANSLAAAFELEQFPSLSLGNGAF